MGLILAGMAGGLGAGLAGAAQEVDRRSREEDLLRERLADRAAARDQNVALQTMLAQQRADAARESNDTRLLIAAERGGSRSGSGSGGGAHSGGVADFSEGTPGEEALALRAERTVPEIRKIRGITRDGIDSLAQDVTRETGIDPNDPNNDGKDKVLAQSNPRVKTTTREVPAELKAFIKAEQANLDQAMTLLRAGGNAEQQAKAYGELAQSNLMKAAADAPTIAGSRNAGQRLANTDPKGGAFDASGDNKFTGELGAVSQGAVAKNERAPVGRGGGAASTTTVQSVKEGADGEMFAVMRDGTTKPLGIKSGAFNARVASMIQKRAKEDYSFSKLPVEQQQSWAREMLANGSSGSGAAPASAAGASKIETAPTDPAKRSVGTVYITPKGNLKWLGNGRWEQS